MTDQQITVEQLKQHVLDLLHGICPAECLGDVDLSLPNFESKVMTFVAQQRADATRELKREIAETAKSAAGWMNACVESNTKLHDLRNELAAAKQQLAEAERDAEIGAAVNRACKELPEGYFIVICLENGAGDIQLKCPDYRLSRNDFEHEADTFGGQINAAIDAAIASQSARYATGCPHLRRTTHKSVIDGSVERDRCADCGEVLLIVVASAAQDQDND